MITDGTLLERPTGTGSVIGRLNVEQRDVVALTRAIEAAVAEGDTERALGALAALRSRLRDHFETEERSMAGLAGYDGAGHAHEHRALLSGLGAIHGAIVAEDLRRLSVHVSGYVNRVARHVFDHDLPFGEMLTAA